MASGTKVWGGGLTVAAGLYGGLDIPNALHGDTVLVVPINELVLKLADLVEKDAHLVGDVGHVLVAGFAPVGQLVLSPTSVHNPQHAGALGTTYRYFHALLGAQLEAAHEVLLHLDELRKLLREIGPKGARGPSPDRMSYIPLGLAHSGPGVEVGTAVVQSRGGLFVAAMGKRLTESAAAEETVLCARGRRRRVLQMERLVSASALSRCARKPPYLDLRRRRRARLAHGIRSVHREWPGGRL